MTVAGNFFYLCRLAVKLSWQALTAGSRIDEPAASSKGSTCGSICAREKPKDIAVASCCKYLYSINLGKFLNRKLPADFTEEPIKGFI
jgi:hypothetical protein